VGAKPGPAEDKPKTASRVKFRTAVCERLWQPIGTNVAMNYDFSAYVWFLAFPKKVSKLVRTVHTFFDLRAEVAL
jgi:hypothetical protein